MVSVNPKLDRVAEDLAELRGRFDVLCTHIEADLARIEARLEHMSLYGLPHRLSTKQRLSIITSIGSAIGAACAALYAILSR